jgi:integrase
VQGHLKLRGKTYHAVIYDQDKKKHVWRSTGETKKTEAEKWLRQALGRGDAGDDVFPEKITVTNLAERWFEHCKAVDNPRHRVRVEYERHIRTHVLPAIGKLEVRRVRVPDVQRILDKYGATRAPRTVAQLRAAISSMFAIAVRWDLVSVNPVRATSAPTPSKPKLTIPTAEQVDKLIEAAADGPFAIAVLLAARTGCRRSEVCALTWDGCDLDRGVVNVDKALGRINGAWTFQEPKTSRAVREVPLTADVVVALRAHKVDQARRRLALGVGLGGWDDRDLIVENGTGAPVDLGTFSHAFQALANKVAPGVRLHDLRHFVATRLANSGLPAHETSAMLGHASVAFTLSTYAHADAQSVDRTRAALEGSR